jgi:signal transduction histidine kinase
VRTRLVETNPLRIFQIFAGLQLGIVLVATVPFLTHVHRGGYHSTAELVSMLVASGVLFGYLLSLRPGRPAWPGFLPLALALALGAPLLGRVVLVREGLSFSDYLSVGGELELFTLFPILVASWRYRLRVVAALAIGLGVAELVVTGLRYPMEVGGVEYGRLVFTRTLGYLAIGYLLTRLMADQRAQHAALSRANADLVNYAATLEELAASRERTRLARELHDTLAHGLSGLAVQLEGVRAVWDRDPDRARGLLAGALADTRAGLVETRRALRDLRAAALEELGLPEALRRCAASAARRCGAELDLELVEPLPALRPDQEQAVYRVAQEALENVVCHAEAGRIRVRLAAVPDRLPDGRVELSVCDDGCGFDPAVAGTGTHFGLRGLRERARLAGARLDVDSRPGGGTTITMVLGPDREPLGEPDHDRG